MNSKPRSDAKLLNLPPEDIEKLRDTLIGGMKYADACEFAAKEFGVRASRMTLLKLSQAGLETDPAQITEKTGYRLNRAAPPGSEVGRDTPCAPPGSEVGRGSRQAVVRARSGSFGLVRACSGSFGLVRDKMPGGGAIGEFSSLRSLSSFAATPHAPQIRPAWAAAPRRAAFFCGSSALWSQLAALSPSREKICCPPPKKEPGSATRKLMHCITNA